MLQDNCYSGFPDNICSSAGQNYFKIFILKYDTSNEKYDCGLCPIQLNNLSPKNLYILPEVLFYQVFLLNINMDNCCL